MSIQRLIARNVMWNSAGMATGMLAGFIVAPFLVRRIGETNYGLWILIASLTGYFGLLDLGVRGSVGRFLAYHRARNAADAVNATLSTAFVILCGLGLIILVCTALLCTVFFRVFDVPAELQHDVRIALILVGLNVALSFPLNLFDAVLWAFQRFDVSNLIEIPTVIVRTILVFCLIQDGNNLITLSAITLASAVVIGVAKLVASFWLDRSLRLSVKMIHFSAGWQIYQYGIWQFLLEASALLSGQLAVILMGIWATMPDVTSYGMAGRLIYYAEALLAACTGVLTPLATTFEAEQDQERQKRLFLQGGQSCAAFAFYFLGLFVFLGGPLLNLWIGRELEHAAFWLTILAIGQVLPMSQWVTRGVVLATGQHRVLACVGLAENVLGAAASMVLVRYYGPTAICVCFAVCAALGRGACQVVYGCRLMQVPAREYVYQVLLRPAAGAALPLALLALLVHWQGTPNWAALLGETSAYSLTYLALLGWMLLSWKGVRAHLVRLIPSTNVCS